MNKSLMQFTKLQKKKNTTLHTRTVSSLMKIFWTILLSALLNWLKLLYLPFWQSNIEYTFSLPRPARKQSNVPKLKVANVLLSDLDIVPIESRNENITRTATLLAIVIYYSYKTLR